MKKTTKKCWRCDSEVLRLFRSMNQKVCHDCGEIMPWFTDGNQKPLIGPSRDCEPVVANPARGTGGSRAVIPG